MFPATNECLDIQPNSHSVDLRTCHRKTRAQAWMVTSDGKIRSEDLCLTWGAMMVLQENVDEEITDMAAAAVSCSIDDKYQTWNVSYEVL